MIIPKPQNEHGTSPQLMSSPFSLSVRSLALERRKGGGGGGDSSSSGHDSSSSSGAKGGDDSDESSSFSHSSAAKPFSLSSSTKSSASAYSDGGGSVVTIPSGSLFSGRQAGGADRVGPILIPFPQTTADLRSCMQSTVYGTSRYGSGYPYGGYGSYVDGRPFPYYFIPVCISSGYYDNDEVCFPLLS